MRAATAWLAVAFLAGTLGWGAGCHAASELLEAAQRGDFERARELASRTRRELNASTEYGWTALTFAVRADDVASVRLLLERGAEANIREKERKLAPLEDGRQLLLNGAPVLRYARSAEVASLLVDHGAEVDAEDADGYRAIHWASAEVARVLLQRGADPNSRQGNSRTGRGAFPGQAQTPLMTQSRSGKQDGVRLLIEAGADVHARDRWQNTALHSAANGSMDAATRSGQRETVQVLLRAKADPNARNSNGWTPLMAAAQSVFLEAVPLLLAAGADPSYCDDVQHRSAADVLASAARGPHSFCGAGECERVIELLRSRGAGKCAALPGPPQPAAAALTSGVLLTHVQWLSDIVVGVALLCAPILGVVIVKRSGRRQARMRLAYLGYGMCALVVALFQLHLYVDGPEIFMVFGLSLLPIAAFAAVGMAMTIAARSERALWLLGAATLALGLAQVATFIGLLGSFMNIVARGYVLLVLGTAAYRSGAWWPTQPRKS
jgi:ankyrin repeat protein